MAHTKSSSFGVFTSQSAVRSRPQEDVNRLYFRTTSNMEFQGKPLMPDEQTESLGHIHYIGLKTTKYMPYPYRQAPLQNKSSCWYTHDYCEKPSDSKQNKALAKTFQYRAPLPPSKSFATKSHYSHTFPDMTTSEIRAAKLPSQNPYRLEQRKTIGGDTNVETKSYSHHMHRAPPKDLKVTGELSSPVHNLELSSKISPTDHSDMLRSMYATDFRGSPTSRKSKDRQGRVSSAPSLLSGATSSVGDEATDVSAKTDSNVYKVRRACYMAPGK